MAQDRLPAGWRGVLIGALACAGFVMGAWPVAAAVPEVPRLGLVDGSDGLPSTEIAGIAQDREGYLWLATGDGLARYDGAGFKVWRHDPADPGSLPGNSLQALYIDGQDRIWVAAEGRGVSVLDAARQHFRHYRSGHPSQLRDEGVFALAGRGDETWFGTQGGELYRIGADGQVRRFDLEHLLPPESLHVMSLASDPAGNLWIGTTAGLLRHDGQRLVREPMPVEDGIFALAWIDDRLWVSSAAGIAQRDGKGRWHLPPWTHRFSSRAGNIAWSMAAAGDGEYWLGTERGLWRTHGDAEPAPAVASQVPVSRRRNVMALLRGDDGGLWVPLHGSGLGYLRADWKRTAVVPLAADLGDGVYCPLMRARAGGLWQIDGGGLSKLDTATGERQPLPWTPPALRDMLVTAGLEDRRGRLWLGNYTNGLARIDLHNGEYRDWLGGTPEYGAPTWIVEDVRGDVWLGVINTVQRRAGDSGALIDSYAAGRDPRLPGEQVSQLGIGPDGEAWVATSSGLQAWQPARGRFEQVPGVTGEPVDLFEVAPDGGLWTYRLGVLESWRQVEGRWQRQRRLDHRDGVPATEAMDLRLDERGRLWLATRRGLWRLDPAASGTLVARAYGLRDGLSSPEFIRGCLRMDEGGVLAGATDDGNLLLVDTRMPDPAPETPPLRIEEVSVLREGRREILPGSGGQQLHSDDRQLRVVARLLAFGGGQGVRYRWRMLGLDEAWSEREGPGLQEFAVLPAGDYVLQVQGIDALGNASTVHQLRFAMPPPWWRSGTGLVLWGALVALLALAGALLYRQRLRARHAWQLAQHKRELAEQASTAKSHFLATLGHEVRTPMTGVLGMTELLLQTPLDARQHDYANAIDVAGRHLLRLVNDALDLARIEAGKLSLEQRQFDPRQLVQQVATLARPLAGRKGLDFRVVVDPALPPALFGDPDRVQQILANLLGNAVKFTEHGRVELHAEAGAEGHGVAFEIRDTGPGLNSEQQSRLFRRFEQADGAHTRARYGGSGLGLAICRELATAMGGVIRVESTAGQGARFRVELPLPWCVSNAAAAVATGAATASEPLQVLLVEDDDTVSRVITGLLEMRGHRVTRVAHGLAALAELDVQDFDVGLFDLDLPGMDGLALVRQLRGMGQALPVFAVTARSDPDAQPQALAAGCTGFLRKPVTGAALAQALASLQPVAATQ